MNGERSLDGASQQAGPRRLRYPAIVELIILGGVVVVLMIGLWMIRSLVTERSRRATSVRAEIASSWGAHQTVGGPALIIPFRLRYVDSEGKEKVITERARFLPDRLTARGQLHPERRHRGIFETVLYRADLHIEGSFAKPDFSVWRIAPEDVLWQEAVVTIGISDLRGIRGNPVLKFGGAEAGFSGGSADTKLWATGLTSRLALDATAERWPFSLDLRLNGSEQLGFLPLGGETVVELSSPWADPSFSGAFLPEARTVSERGFTARWSISSLARSYPQKWRDSSEESGTAPAAMTQSAFGVGLFSPVGHYQKTSAR